MKTTLLISLHEKALQVLEAVKKAERMIEVHTNSAETFEAAKMASWIHSNQIEHNRKRIAINTAIAARLRAYYTRIMSRIVEHSPKEKEAQNA